MSKKIVGIEKRFTKSDKTYYMLYVLSDEKKDGLIGNMVSSEYVSADKFPDNLKVGDNVNLYFDKGFQDKAFLSFIDIIK